MGSLTIQECADALARIGRVMRVDGMTVEDDIIDRELFFIVEQLDRIASVRERANPARMAMSKPSFEVTLPSRARGGARMQTPSPSRPAKKRKLSAWQQYLKTELPKLKKKHPRMSHASIMTKASIAWDKSNKNPNKGSRRRRMSKK